MTLFALLLPRILGFIVVPLIHQLWLLLALPVVGVPPPLVPTLAS
jgi:hypothetical protein